MKTIAFYLCKLDGKGRAVKVAQRKTFRGISRLADKHPAYGSVFVVGEYLADDHKEDHGTVYFFDLSGTSVEMASV